MISDEDREQMYVAADRTLKFQELFGSDSSPAAQMATAHAEDVLALLGVINELESRSACDCDECGLCECCVDAAHG